jgi:hypothetical protein
MGCVAQAIIDIESLGIYNADIMFRNTIKANDGLFKMIDFDRAYIFKII